MPEPIQRDASATTSPPPNDAEGAAVEPNVGDAAATSPNDGVNAVVLPSVRNDAMRRERQRDAVPTQWRDAATWKFAACRAMPMRWGRDDGAVCDGVVDSLQPAKRFGVGVARP